MVTNNLKGLAKIREKLIEKLSELSEEDIYLLLEKAKEILGETRQVDPNMLNTKGV